MQVNPDLGEIKFLKKILVNLSRVGDRNNSWIIRAKKSNFLPPTPPASGQEHQPARRQAGTQKITKSILRVIHFLVKFGGLEI